MINLPLQCGSLAPEFAAECNCSDQTPVRVTVLVFLACLGLTQSEPLTFTEQDKALARGEGFAHAQPTKVGVPAYISVF